MPLVLPDLEIPIIREPNRKHLDLVDYRFAVHPDVQAAPELIESKIDLMSLLGTYFEYELHPHRLTAARTLPPSREAGVGMGLSVQRSGQ
jgi:hypothetical protein